MGYTVTQKAPAPFLTTFSGCSGDKIYSDADKSLKSGEPVMFIYSGEVCLRALRARPLISIADE